MAKNFEIKEDSIVVITYGWNPVLQKPLERIAQFKYLNKFENPICCPVGETSTQSSFVLDLSKGCTIRVATEEEKNEVLWER